jgi:predicted enzyme related to lactoylglutathione lyase
MNAERNPVGWFEIYVQEMDRARAFYERTLDVTLQELPSATVKMLAFPMQPDLPGACGALVQYEGKDSGAGGTLIYFSCEDCAVEASRAVANGGQIVKEKFSIGPYGFIALVFDTEKNMIGLHSMK